MGQNTSNSVWKPCEDLQKTFDLCHCQQRVYNKVLRCNFVIDQILIFHHNLQINSLKILQCDFLDCFSYFVSHSWGIPMMKITGLSHLFKWENLHNWWLTKYFFAPLYISHFRLCFKQFWYKYKLRNLRKKSELWDINTKFWLFISHFQVYISQFWVCILILTLFLTIVSLHLTNQTFLLRIVSLYLTVLRKK